jgi:branched-chain amino acid transport system substrate-binding protein
MFTEAMIKFIKDMEKKFTVKYRTAGLIWENTLFGADSAKVERNLAQMAGIRIVEDLPYKANATSLTSEIQRLKAADPDILFPTSYANDAILMLRTMRELDYNPKLVLAQDAGHTMAAFLDTVKTEADGISSRNVWADDLVAKFPQVGYVGELYKKHSGGRPMTEIPIRGLVGLLVLADAINRAGSVEPEAIRAALKATDIPAKLIPMPWRGIKFDETQQNHLVEAIITQIQGGKHWTVWPFELAAKEVIYPIPKWSERRR